MSTRRLAACACLALVSATLAPARSAESTTIVIQPAPATAPPAATLPAEAPFAGERAAVDVALLLDTSNSMDGLISQAKTQLWTIVQQFARAKHAGQTPTLRVALFEYGNTNLPASEGYLRQVVPLTDDLDALSDALFALTTNGGDEYCGQVINEAVTRLDWSDAPNAYQ
ncbi:MAG: VWA domain-containing protein, partial [Planctomycetota bacterium]